MRFIIAGIAVFLLLLFVTQLQVVKMKREIIILNKQIDSLKSETFILNIQLSRYQNVVEIIAKKYPKAVEEAEYMTE